MSDVTTTGVSWRAVVSDRLTRSRVPAFHLVSVFPSRILALRPITTPAVTFYPFELVYDLLSALCCLYLDKCLFAYAVLGRYHSHLREVGEQRQATQVLSGLGVATNGLEDLVSVDGRPPYHCKLIVRWETSDRRGAVSWAGGCLDTSCARACGPRVHSASRT